MMPRLLTALFTALVVPPLFAQDFEMPKPAAVLAQFEPLIGVWEGSGTYRESAETDAMEWSGTMTFSRILEGFAVQEDLVVDVGAPSPLLMRTIYAVDNESGETIAYGMSNQGNGSRKHFSFPAKGEMSVYGVERSPNGDGVIRSRIHFDKDSYHFEYDNCRGVGAVFIEVAGNFKRGKAARAAANAAFADVPLAAEMKSLAAIVGNYTVKGTMVTAPGSEAMPVTGTETYHSLWGGSVLMSEVLGDAPPGMPTYVSHSYMIWSPSTNCYEFVTVDTMGVAAVANARWTTPGKELVATWQGSTNGQLTVQNTVLTLGEKGIASVTSRALTGGHEPYVSFQATYGVRQSR
ncbi:MAG: DUF1579 family protein [Planctomycetota bacterium]